MVSEQQGGGKRDAYEFQKDEIEVVKGLVEAPLKVALVKRLKKLVNDSEARLDKIGRGELPNTFDNQFNQILE
jgi:hypothetical protein